MMDYLTVILGVVALAYNLANMLSSLEDARRRGERRRSSSVEDYVAANKMEAGSPHVTTDYFGNGALRVRGAAGERVVHHLGDPGARCLPDTGVAPATCGAASVRNPRTALAAVQMLQAVAEAMERCEYCRTRRRLDAAGRCINCGA